MSESTKINIRANGVDYEIDTPQYDYTTTIPIALLHTALEPRNYGIWDNGSANDGARICEAIFQMNATLTNTLLEIINDQNKGRGVSVVLKLGTNSGFYPFGPDRGDSGNFDIRLISIKSPPVQSDPWLYFSTRLVFSEESNPSYSLPSEVDEGKLQIGTITGLRYPPDFPNSQTDYNFSTQLTYDGTAFTVDKLTDGFVTTLNMVLRHNKAAALINHLMVTVRGNDLNIITQGNNYVFGRENGASGVYSCQWLNESTSITHVRYDQFAFGLNFSLKVNNIYDEVDLRGWYPFNEAQRAIGYSPNCADITDGETGRLVLEDFEAGEEINNNYLNIIDAKDGQAKSEIEATLQITGDITVIVWYKWIDGANRTGWIVYTGKFGPDAEESNHLYTIDMTAASVIEILHEYGSGSNQWVVTNTTFPRDGNYHMLMVRRDTTAKTYEVSIDNGTIDTLSYSNNPTGGSSSRTFVGGNVDDTARGQADGEYTDVLIIAEKLTDEQVSKIYYNGFSDTEWFDYSNWDGDTGTGYVTRNF